jgi:trehalose-phosphatase
VAGDVHQRIGRRHLLLLTDFDGTLADIEPVPADARMSAVVRHEFERLAGTVSVTVGVVSGRRLPDVAERVGPAAEFVAGLHGLEITGPNCAFHHYALDSVEPAIQRVATLAARELAWCPGLLLENKVYSLTCHVRRSPPDLGERALEEFEAIVEPHLEAGTLRLLTGRMALELLPAVDWHKGRAVEWIRARLAARIGPDIAVLYLGDDRTDEDAFTALADHDIVIGVGYRPHTHLIDWRLEGPEAVGRLFGRLAGLRA